MFGGGDDALFQQEGGLLQLVLLVVERQARLAEIAANPRHFGIVRPILDLRQVLGGVDVFGERFPVFAFDLGGVQLQQLLPDGDALAVQEVRLGDLAGGRTRHQHFAARGQAPEYGDRRDEALRRDGDRAAVFGNASAWTRRCGGRRRQWRVPGHGADEHEQADDERGRRHAGDLHLAQSRRQRLVALFQVPVGALQFGVLRFQRLRQTPFAPLQLLELGDIREHGDDATALPVVGAAQVGRGKREQVDCVVHPHLHRARFVRLHALHGVDDRLAEVVEALFGEEQLGQRVVEGRVGGDAEQPLRCGIERHDAPLAIDAQHALAHVREDFAVDGEVAPVHGPSSQGVVSKAASPSRSTRSTSSPQVCSVVPRV